MEPSAKPAHQLLSFINASPSPFHAVHSGKEHLHHAGFEEIKERDDWTNTCTPGGKYYLTRNGSTLVAFAIGQKWKPGNPIGMIGAHTDSPCLRVKPVSKKQGSGFLEVGVETYGGGRWSTWFDRDLSIAGRIMVKERGNRIAQKLVKINRPILRIPTLAIHLDREDPFKFNKETQVLPIAGLVAAELNSNKESSDSQPAGSDQFTPLKSMRERHHPDIVELLAKEANIDPALVVDFEVVLYDTQKSCIGGINEELLLSARLDNLCMSFCATEALVDSVKSASSLEQESGIRLIALFDHEEIGSTSAQGAGSDTLPAILRRLSIVGDPKMQNAAYERSMAKSFLISADMAHSVHPNYSDKHEADHRPEMNQGTVIKINANQRYATNSPGIVLLQEAAAKAQVPLQLFVVRNDSPCGSTIGPMLSAALGARTLDLGNPQLSMHSIRETGGVYDVHYAIKLFESFFNHYSALEKEILVD